MDIESLVKGMAAKAREDAEDAEKLTDLQQVTRLREYDWKVQRDHTFRKGQIVRHHSQDLMTYRTSHSPMMFVKYIKQVNGYDVIAEPDDLTDINSAREYDCMCRCIISGKAVEYLFDSRTLEPHPDFTETEN